MSDIGRNRGALEDVTVFLPWWGWLFLGATLLSVGIASAGTADRTKGETVALRWGPASYLLGIAGLLTGAVAIILVLLDVILT
jgi:hypothetical protein